MSVVVPGLIARAVKKAMDSSFWQNRFYVLGLVAQKGLPLLILPLIVDIFGRDVYGDYVLFFTLVQVYATISSGAIPQTIVPLWFRKTQPQQFLGICIVTLAMLAVAFAVLAEGLALFLGSAFSVAIHALPFSMPVLVVWLVAFSLSYSLNALAVGTARVQDRQHHFFWGMGLGGGVLILGIGSCALLGMSSLRILILIQIVSTLAAAMVLFGRQPLTMLRFDLTTLRQEVGTVISIFPASWGIHPAGPVLYGVG